MKLNKYIGWSLGVMALFSGCADNDFSEPRGPWDGEVPEELNIVVNVADPDLVKVGETRSDDGTITSLTVMQYDKDGQFLGMVTPAVTKVNGKYNINVKLDKAVSELQFAANHTVSGSCRDLSKEVVTDALPANANELAAWNPVLWGKTTLSALLTDANRYEPSIVLYRQVAKVSVTNSASNFQYKGFGVYKTADRGTVAPTNANYTASAPTIADGVAYSAKVEKLNADGIAYVYETPKESDTNTPKVIVEGEIGGKTYYYVAGFRNRTGSGASDNAGDDKYQYTALDILRNHHYAFEITSVRGEGWATLEEAINAQPDNRMTVWVSDINDEINDMVSSRDYLLGVNNEVTVAWNAKPEITIVTSYPISNGEGKKIPEEIKLSLKDEADNWIWTHDPELKLVTEGTDRETGKAIKKVTIALPVIVNDKQTSSRVGTVVVRVGDLTREIRLTQEGRPLRHDLKAFIYGLTGVANGADYYDWVNNTCKGLQPVDNRGLDRNNALIFAAVPAYGTEGIWYKIPKVLPAKAPAVQTSIVSYELDNTADFIVDNTTDASYIIIKAKENSKPKLASGKLILKAENGAEIDYELLQVGYFHELKTEKHAQYTRGDFNAGWYYYEVTKLNGYFILDRNIGASTNNSFDPTSINYSPEDERAKGLYFVVNKKKADFDQTTDVNKRWQDKTTIIVDLGMDYGSAGRFNIPTEVEFTAMGFKQNDNRGPGAVYAMVDVDSKVSDNKIFLPAGGYYFGNILKNPTHVNVWTRTLLAGSQGLVETDAEYGCMYRYLNIVGGVVSYQNLRTSAGADGQINNSLRNYLPLRLAWSEKGTVNIPVPTPSERNNFVAGDKLRFSWTSKSDGSWADGIWIGYSDNDYVEGKDWNAAKDIYETENNRRYRDVVLEKECSQLIYKLRPDGFQGLNVTLKYETVKSKYDEASGMFIINLNGTGAIQ